MSYAVASLVFGAISVTELRQMVQQVVPSGGRSRPTGDDGEGSADSDTGDGADRCTHVSVVICTRNREDKIANAIESVLANDYPSFDVTIVDQSTSSATEGAVTPIADRDSRVHYLHRDQAGLSRAYNTGVENSTGDVLAFTDDDCIVEASWIADIVRAFEERARRGIALRGRRSARRDARRDRRDTAAAVRRAGASERA